MTDRELVTRALKGDHAAFSAVMKNTGGLVSQIVCKMVPSPADRKDIAQDAYMKVFRNLRGFRFESKLSTWIGQITYHTCLKYLRKKKLVVGYDLPPEMETLVSGDEPEALMSKKQLNEFLHQAMERLPPVYRTLVTLFHREELSIREIGEITGLPEGTVKSYLFRARRALKEDLISVYKNEAL